MSFSRFGAMVLRRFASGASRFRGLLVHRHGGLWLALFLCVVGGFATRSVLLGKAAGEVSWDGSLLGAFACGVVFDVANALLGLWVVALMLAALPVGMFASRVGRAAAKVALFALVYGLLFGAVAEWVFWDEFGVRFNFIAVDYLVYTTEVIGNIRESYPMPAIYLGTLGGAVAVYLVFQRTRWIDAWLDNASTPPRKRWLTAGAWVAVAALAGVALRQEALPRFANNYNRELAKNGLWSLFAAFRDNQLDFERFYPTLPEDTAFQRVHRLLAADGATPLGDDPRDVLRLVRHAGPEERLNVVQITVESLSADFLSSFNRAAQLTPNLDALARKSLLFDRFYATGTRTDRGMEALTLSVPPTPGRSLVKRPHNENLFTLGSVFRTRGYETAFLYGGFGYFDNMNHFFGENGYRVVDRTKVATTDVTFANVWGACDEDLFRWTTREADRDFAAGKPFFYFVMTTSNHRPFTYPEGRIDLPSKISGRSGGVKYSDYAIGEFLRAAEAKPWFKHTVFVIVGDHCASSAGKTDLPVQNYHIPLLVYAPGGQIAPGVVHAMASQIDFGPTLLGLLHWSYPSRFYGRDVLAWSDDASNRALLGNYQKLGLLRGDSLGVLKPVRQSAVYRYEPVRHELQPLASDPELVNDTIAYYQTASWLFKNGRQHALSPSELARARQILDAPLATHR